MNLRIASMVLLIGVFALGSVSGAFIYATGKEVVTDTFMQMISHTEYRYGEQGQIIARLVDYQGNPVVVDNCTATILYPNKSYFVNQSLMTETVNISGDHYYQFTTPNGPEGVYEYQATCAYTVGVDERSKSVTNSFHLSGAFNSVLDNLTEIDNTLNSNFTLTFSYLEDINVTLDNVSNYVDYINTTTVNTYDYVTGTLTNSVDQILIDLGVMNETLNRIETYSVDINDTVTTILQNQQDEVFMTVFSG